MYLCTRNYDLKRGGTFETAKAGTFHSVTAGTSIPLFTNVDRTVANAFLFIRKELLLSAAATDCRDKITKRIRNNKRSWGKT